MPKHLPYILTVGSGTIEYIANIDGRSIEWGGKQVCDLATHVGGSAVNYSMRLLGSGFNTLPILSIGDDEAGRRLQATLARAASESGVDAAIQQYLVSSDNDHFLVSGIRTSSTIIIVAGENRTIFTQKIADSECFFDHLRARVDEIITELTAPCALMIGHIYADARTSALRDGQCTKFLLDHFQNKSLIFANLGNSQLALGLDFWRDHLSAVDLLQLNLNEARGFFNHCSSLIEILQEVRMLKMNAIITLDKFGAIGIHRDNPEQVVLAWPLIHAEKVVDTTGAGDAFAAGVVANLASRTQTAGNASSFDFIDLATAVEKARIWSALACQSIGGANECPDKDTLDTYQDLKRTREYRPVEIKDNTQLVKILARIESTSL